eukprot:scaffold38426_cov38-Prasinocladus_malaysianus.AAC.1
MHVNQSIYITQNKYKNSSASWTVLSWVQNSVEPQENGDRKLKTTSTPPEGTGAAIYGRASSCWGMSSASNYKPL